MSGEGINRGSRARESFERRTDAAMPDVKVQVPEEQSQLKMSYIGAACQWRAEDDATQR